MLYTQLTYVKMLRIVKGVKDNVLVLDMCLFAIEMSLFIWTKKLPARIQNQIPPVILINDKMIKIWSSKSYFAIVLQGWLAQRITNKPFYETTS